MNYLRACDLLTMSVFGAYTGKHHPVQEAGVVWTTGRKNTAGGAHVNHQPRERVEAAPELTRDAENTPNLPEDAENTPNLPENAEYAEDAPNTSVYAEDAEEPMPAREIKSLNDSAATEADLSRLMAGQKILDDKNRSKLSFWVSPAERWGGDKVYQATYSLKSHSESIWRLENEMRDLNEADKAEHVRVWGQYGAIDERDPKYDRFMTQSFQRRRLRSQYVSEINRLVAERRKIAEFLTSQGIDIEQAEKAECLRVEKDFYKKNVSVRGAEGAGRHPAGLQRLHECYAEGIIQSNECMPGQVKGCVNPQQDAKFGNPTVDIYVNVTNSVIRDSAEVVVAFDVAGNAHIYECIVGNIDEKAVRVLRTRKVERGAWVRRHFLRVTDTDWSVYVKEAVKRALGKTSWIFSPRDQIYLRNLLMR